MTTTKIQLRGHCQRCGNLQAVRGAMSAHGYTVKRGWFEGVCRGHNYVPMETSIDETIYLVAGVRKEVADLLALAVKIEAGTVTPKFVIRRDHVAINPDTGRYGVDIEVPFADADEYDQKQAVASLLWNTRNRAAAGTDFADSMEALANETHGKPLLEVIKGTGPAPIPLDDKRAYGNTVAIVTSVQGAEVWFKYVQASTNKTLTRRMSSRAWRALPLAA